MNINPIYPTIQRVIPPKRKDQKIQPVSKSSSVYDRPSKKGQIVDVFA